MHVAGYVEELTKSREAPSVKQSLAAVRMLHDWLVVGQVVRSNPASSFRSVPLTARNAFAMVQRRAKAAGIATKIGCHTFRATGITIYLTNGGDLEKAQQMAAHESPRTTKLSVGCR